MPGLWPEGTAASARAAEGTQWPTQTGQFKDGVAKGLFPVLWQGVGGQSPGQGTLVPQHPS